MWQAMGCFELLLSVLVHSSAELFHYIIISNNALNLGGLSFLELCSKKKIHISFHHGENKYQ